MRMSIPGGIAACAIVVAVPLLSVALLSTPAFAAKQSAVLAACKRTPGCWIYRDRSGGYNGCSPNACFQCYKGSCSQLIKATGGAKVQTGPTAVVTTPKSSRGSTPIQTGPTAVITSTPVRPTGPSGSFHGKGR
jgi:hypothetical protein